MKSLEVQVSATQYLHLRSVGEGTPTVLLLHGWALSGRLWDSLLARWPGSNQGTLLAADLRGSGWSSKPESGYALDDYTNDIVCLLDKLALSPLVLVGHSMGGTIAMRVALERPAALTGLVLVSPVPPGGVPLSAADVAYFQSLGGHAQGAEQVVRMMMAAPTDEAVSQLVDSAATVSKAAFLGALDAWRTASFADKVGHIQTPTVVLCGAGEQPLSPTLLQEHVVSKIPGARLVTIPGVGHYPQVEAPDAFSTTLRLAINQVLRTAPHEA